MELAMQITSSDKTVRRYHTRFKRIQLSIFNDSMQNGRTAVSMMPAIKKAFNLLGNDIVELSVENDSLKNQIGEYNEQWLEESKAKLLKDIDDEKRANLIMLSMKKQMNKQN